MEREKIKEAVDQLVREIEPETFTRDEAEKLRLLLDKAPELMQLIALMGKDAMSSKSPLQLMIELASHYERVRWLGWLFIS